MRKLPRNWGAVRNLPSLYLRMQDCCDTGKCPHQEYRKITDMGEKNGNNLRIFVGDEPVAISADTMVAPITQGEIERPMSYSPLHGEFSCEVEVSGLTDKVKELLGMKSRVFTMSERRLFIRTVERYGRVEFTLKDFQGYVEPDCQSVSTVAMASGFITIVCTTPRMVRRFLRMRDLGNVSYRIMTRAAA